MAVKARSRGALHVAGEDAPTVCEFCGQALLKQEAVRHLLHARQQFEKNIRAQARTEAEKGLEAKIQARVRAIEGEVTAKERQIAALKKQHAKERAALRSTAEKEARQRLAREFAGKERTLRNALSKLEDDNEQLRRRLDRVTAQERGDWSEEDFLRELKRAFPEDDIRRHARGQRGGDILHEVRDATAGGVRPAGLIVYECKDVLTWSSDFIRQARQAGVTHKTPHLVLVTRSSPRNLKEFFVKDGVCVVSPLRALHLAHLMRRMVVEVHRAGLTLEGMEAKTEALLAYLSSADFRQAFDAIARTSADLKKLLHDEQRKHETVWTRRERAYTDLAKRHAGIDETIRGIIEQRVGGKAAKVIRLPSADRRG